MPELSEVKIPDIGDFADVEIIEVLVAPGDKVTAEDPLLTLESDKATMEIPSPADGVIHSINVEVGNRVSEGSVVMMLEAAEKSSQSAADGEAIKSESPAPAAASVEVPTSIDSSADEGTKPESSPPASLPPPVQKSGTEVPHASPGVRRFARELGADLTQVNGSGPKGRILKEDVKKWIKHKLSSATVASKAGTGIPEIPAVDFTKFGEIETVSLSRIKKLSGPHLQRAWLNIPHVTHQDETDITELEEFRQSIKEESAKEGIRITLLGFVMKTLVGALKNFPNFNASLHPNGENLILKKYFNIGIAVDTPNGLVVPVIKDVDRKSISELAASMGELSQKAREGKLSPADMQGGCISISSLGGIGGTAFSPIVNAPEVAILGLARSRIKPIWDGEQFQPRLMQPLSLSYDHRVIDGAEAARFCAYLSRSLADVRRLAL
ncbi:MAG: dihydrolipoyllysine-residue acetyltransferase [Arenicellales bacterium]